MSLREFLPPVLHRAIIRWRQGKAPLYETYEEAQAASGEGYADTELAAIVLEKTRRIINGSPRKTIDQQILLNTLLAVGTAASLSNARPLRVLDFGGAFGTAYFSMREMSPLPLRWAVVESSTFAAAATELEDDNLRFFSNPTEAAEWLGEVDLLYSSGAIQYTPNPEAQLSELLNLKPQNMAWLRGAFSRGKRFVELQTSTLSNNGPGELPSYAKNRTIRYPRTHMPIDQFTAELAKDYELIFRFSVPDGETVIAGMPVSLDDGFLYTRRGS